MPRPLCFVLMPFGKKPDASGRLIDFDAVYADLIRPGIEAADLEPLRADEEVAGGIIHAAMFERLVLCDYAVADLTTANANVFYELGVRHAVRPWSTVLLFASSSRLPFDVSSLRALPYDLAPSGVAADPEPTREALTARLVEARKASTDSPVFKLVEGIRPAEIDHAKTDTFRQQVEYSHEMKRKLETARREGEGAVRAEAEALGPIADVEAGVVMDLFLSYRAVKAWDAMIDLVDAMSPPLRRTVMVQEQLGFALNRAGRREDAERVLRDVLDAHGASSETFGLLGRVYKDQWEDALSRGEKAAARGYLRKAIDAYRSGFEADWRDAFPGVNAVTLMELQEPPDPAREQLVPVVSYAVERRIAAGEPDYWDHATVLELSVLGRERRRAEDALSDALACVRESWEPETTARNLRLIREARERRGDADDWAEELEGELDRRAEQ